MRLITLLTDFGLRDGFVGVMKGVIAGIAPGVRVVDLSHDVPPQNIRAAAFLLESSHVWFPPGSVHTVVVDPGVGSSRRGLAVFSRGHFFVGPDNGVLTPVLEGADMYSLEEPEYWLPEVSQTFHGRDIFSPVAAHLALGVPIAEFGVPISDPVLLDSPQPGLGQKGWRGVVVHVDRFGNLVTDFEPGMVEGLALNGPVEAVLADGTHWPVRSTYSSVPRGERCAVMGGFARLELSINCGSAANATGCREGTEVLLRQALA